MTNAPQVLGFGLGHTIGHTTFGPNAPQVLGLGFGLGDQRPPGIKVWVRSHYLRAQRPTGIRVWGFGLGDTIGHNISGD